MLLRIKDFFRMPQVADLPIQPSKPVDVEDLAPQYPDDPDEISEDRQRKLDRARALGITLPRYDTRRQWEEQLALATQRILAAEEPEQDAPESDGRSHALPGPEAARAFLHDLRVRGGAGTYSSDELSAAYADHCERCNRVPTPENVFRKALLEGDGVERIIRDERIDGKRRRAAVWVIQDLADAEIPYPFEEAA